VPVTSDESLVRVFVTGVNRKKKDMTDKEKADLQAEKGTEISSSAFLRSNGW